MSDGPHKSLPMKRKWQDVAERADNITFEIEEIGDAMVPALAEDCRDEISPEFIEKIRGVFEVQETLLIKEDVRGRVEALEPEAGTGIGRRLIENIARISSTEAADLSLLIKAAVAALTERAARRSRQVEEHYLRESSASRAMNVRARLEKAAASIPLDTLARQVLKLNNHRLARSPAKQDGLDEGPGIR